MSSIKTLVHICSGMGNRFKCLLGALYVSDEVRIFWPTYLDKNMMSHTQASIDPYADIIKNGVIEVKDNNEIGRLMKHEGFVVRNTHRWHDKLAIDFNFDLMRFQKERAAFHELAKRYLVPSDKVQAIYDARIAAVSECKHGVFIRTGDTQKQEYDWPFWKIEDFNINPDIKTFVVGDSPKVYEHFRNKPNVVCYLEQDYIYSGWPGHYANMLLLAQCPRLTMPRVSTYSEMVYVLNGYKAQLDLVEKVTDRGKAYDSQSIHKMRFHLNKLKNGN